MSAEELRSILSETLGNFQEGMRKEFGHFQEGMRKEFASFKAEVNQRMDTMQMTLLEVKGSVALVDYKVVALDKKVDGLDKKVDGLDKKVDGCISVLDEATKKIQEMQGDLINLDNKIDDRCTGLRQDILRVDTNVQTLHWQVIQMDRRLTTHINQPWNKAHREPGHPA
jgi:chromosome segregation ATPase